MVFDKGAYLRQYFESQLATNVTRSFALDELYCLIYLLLQSDRPDPIFPRANERQLEELEKLKPFIHSVFDATKTSDITRICEQIVFRVNDGYEDTMNEYFIFPIASVEKYKANTLFDELTRNDELLNDDTDDADEEKVSSLMKNSRLGIGRTRTVKVIRRFSNLNWSRERKQA